MEDTESITAVPTKRILKGLRRNYERSEEVNRRQRKKRYKARYGYAKAEEAKVQCMIRETIKYAEDAIDRAEKERTRRTYASFLGSIRTRRRNKARWWKRTR